MTHRTTYRITRLRTAAVAAGLAVALCGAAGAAVAASATATGPANARPVVSADGSTVVAAPSPADWNSTGS